MGSPGSARSCGRRNPGLSPVRLNAWLIGSPAWLVDPGPVDEGHFERLEFATVRRRRAGGNRPHPPSSRSRRGGACAAQSVTAYPCSRGAAAADPEGFSEPAGRRTCDRARARRRRPRRPVRGARDSRALGRPRLLSRGRRDLSAATRCWVRGASSFRPAAVRWPLPRSHSSACAASSSQALSPDTARSVWGTRREKLAEYIDAPARPRATARGGARPGGARRARRCSTRSGTTRPRSYARPPR